MPTQFHTLKSQRNPMRFCIVFSKCKIACKSTSAHGKRQIISVKKMFAIFFYYRQLKQYIPHFEIFTNNQKLANLLFLVFVHKHYNIVLFTLLFNSNSVVSMYGTFASECSCVRLFVCICTVH